MKGTTIFVAGVLIFGIYFVWDAMQTEERSTQETIENITGTDVKARRHALKRLARTVSRPDDPDRDKAVRALLKALHEPRASRDAIEAMLPHVECVDVLVLALKNGDSFAQARASAGLARMAERHSDRLDAFDEASAALQEKVDSDDAAIRANAIRALAQFGPEVMDALVTALGNLRAQDEDAAELAGAAAHGLARHGTAAIPHIRAAIAKGNKWAMVAGAAATRVVAARQRSKKVGEPPTLAPVSPEVAGLVPVLGELLDSPDPDLRQEAVRALGAIGPEARPVLPALLAGLNDPDLGGAPSAAVASIGAGEEHLPQLLEALMHAKRHASDKIAEAIVSIGPEVAPTMISALAAENYPLVRGAVLALMKMTHYSYPHEEAKAKVLPAVPKLIGLLSRDGAEQLRPLVLTVLEQMGTAAKAGVPGMLAAQQLLVEQMPEKDMEVDIMLPRALAAMGSESVRQLEAGLKAPEPGVRLGAMIALGIIGEEARPALPSIEKHLTSPDPAMRYQAVKAIANILRKSPDEAVKKLQPALGDSHPEVVEKAQEAIDFLQTGQKPR